MHTIYDSASPPFHLVSRNTLFDAPIICSFMSIHARL